VVPYLLGLMDWIRAVARITLGDGSHGTGFLISSDGLVLTAFHVVAYRDKSLEKLAPVWRPGPYEVTFGDPNTPATQWTTGPAKLYLDRYGIDDDWAMLEIAKPPGDVVPLQLADYELPRADNRFSTFGFPTVKAAIGGVYHGTVLNWQAQLAELDAANLEADASVRSLASSSVIASRSAVANSVRYSALGERQRRVGASPRASSRGHEIGAAESLERLSP